MLLFLLLVACPQGESRPKLGSGGESTACGAAPYQGRFSTDPLLTLQDALSIPVDNVDTARAEIFARHGRVFSDRAMQAHFEALDWYCAHPDFDEGLLTRNDRQNVHLLLSVVGDHALELQERGRFVAEDGTVLRLNGAQRVYIVRPDQPPGWEPHALRWRSRGDWLLTWGGAAHFALGSRGAEHPQAWLLDRDSGKILRMVELTPAGAP